MWVCISDCSTWSGSYRQLLKALWVCWSSAIAPAFNLSNTFKGSGELTRLSEKTLLPKCSQQTAALTKEGLWQPSLTVTSTTASSPNSTAARGLTLAIHHSSFSLSGSPDIYSCFFWYLFFTDTHIYSPLSFVLLYLLLYIVSMVYVWTCTHVYIYNFWESILSYSGIGSRNLIQVTRLVNSSTEAPHQP